MPRKKRDIRKDYRDLGFSERAAKHSKGTTFYHPLVRDIFTVAGHDRADADHYDERNLRQARNLLEEAKKRRQP